MKSDKYMNLCPMGCDAGLETTDIGLAEGCLIRCKGCGHLFSQITEAEYHESMAEFDRAEGTWPSPEDVASLEHSTKKTLRNIRQVTKKDLTRLKLLDVGCSNGAFIFTAGRLGITCEGVEPAKNAAVAAQQAGLNVFHGFLEEMNFQEAAYDVITLFEVIEHVKNPMALLTQCHRVLKKGGILVIRTANTRSWTVQAIKGKWHYFDIRRHGGHISFFCRQSMTALAAKTGFRLVRFKTHSVTLCEKTHVSAIRYRGMKIMSELLNLPAKITENGQEMEVYLQKS
jgi:2-polyprenyl-3-methyl-5-hydroxy-6-metoxy-1,4-benzoquinol methylase